MTSPADFLKLHAPWAQATATVTGIKTDLFRDAQGKPKLLVSGWPLKHGIRMGSFAPGTTRKSSKDKV